MSSARQKLTLALISLLMIPLIQSCSAKKNTSGGIGCSKPSSVLKAPTIQTEADPTHFEPDSDAQTSRFLKYFGGATSKASGGYIYFTTRAEGDPLGPVSNDFKRCSVVVEYPKSVGEKTLNQFEVSDRYPSYTDDIKLRIYTAAHCLDFSLNEEVTLSLFQVNDRLLPKFNDAYLNFKVKIPELEAVKNLRKNLNEKISTSFTTDMAKKIMLSFAPRTRDLEAVFGTVSGGATPTARNRCIIKPENIDGYQYSCATYHDTAVFDVEPVTPFSQKQIALFRELRDTQIKLSKFLESRSLFENYVVDTATHDTIDAIFNLQTPPYVPVLSSESPCYNDATLNGATRLFVLKTPPVSETNPNKKCVDFPIANYKTAHYFYYSIRERMKTFSKLNMIASIYKLTDAELSLQSCASSPSNPQCTAKDDVQTALNEIYSGLNLDDGSVTNFLSPNSAFGRSMENVDYMIDAWSPFINALPPTPADTFILNVLNPLWNVNFHSNFVVQRDTVTALPQADDTILKRAFMTLPVKNIVGADVFPDSGEKPILIDNWSAGGSQFATGKFLRLFTNSTILDSFRSQFAQSFRFPQVEDYLMRPATLPTVVTLQKGDSGSVFSIDAIPIFALSTVNGEPTSGGAAVRAIPVASEDTDDTLPQETTVVGGNTGGTATTSAAVCK